MILELLRTTSSNLESMFVCPQKEEDEDIFHDSCEDFSDSFHLMSEEEEEQPVEETHHQDDAVHQQPEEVDKAAPIFPEVSIDEVKIGKILGAGGFASVYEITSTAEILCKSAADKSATTYALKRLDEDLLDEDTSATHAAGQDLLVEATILSKLPPSKHIVQLLAVSEAFWERPVDGFIVLQQVVDTLSTRLFQQSKTRGEKRLTQKGRFRQVAPGLARAMAFLHRNKVIYRDLKPQNVGFDKDGNIVVFDFGLSRFHHPDDGRKLTGRTGSARYMAPEVARGQQYSYQADVHSFSILLWEVCTLQKAFASARNMTQLLRQVSHANARPSTQRIESASIKAILKQCWHPEPAKRMTFAKILDHLDPQAEKKPMVSSLQA